jgi:hypothetical protein
MVPSANVPFAGLAVVSRSSERIREMDARIKSLNRSSAGASGLSPVSRRNVIRAAGGTAAALAGAQLPLAARERYALQATPDAAEETPLELVYAFEARFTGALPVGVTLRGVRLDLPYTGEVVEGPLTGAAVGGTDYLLLRPDGVGVMDVRAFITTQEGDIVAVKAGGYVFMPEGVELPPPDVFLSPDFVWPDMDFTLRGFGLYETGSAALEWFNRAALIIGGTANMGPGTLYATAHAFYPIPGRTTG